VAFIAGYALAGCTSLRRGRLPADVVKTLVNALKRCAVYTYLTIDGMMPPLSIRILEFPYCVETFCALGLAALDEKKKNKKKSQKRSKRRRKHA
jgi:hypothetical protein